MSSDGLLDKVGMNVMLTMQGFFWTEKKCYMCIQESRRKQALMEELCGPMMCMWNQLFI